MGGMTSGGFGSPDPRAGSDDGIVIVDSETAAAAAAGQSEEDAKGVADMVEQPAKVMRIGTMIKQLLEEVRAAPLDEASRNRLREIHQSSIRELEDGLAPELREELERLALARARGGIQEEVAEPGVAQLPPIERLEDPVAVLERVFAEARLHGASERLQPLRERPSIVGIHRQEPHRRERAEKRYPGGGQRDVLTGPSDRQEHRVRHGQFLGRVSKPATTARMK